METRFATNCVYVQPDCINDLHLVVLCSFGFVSIISANVIENIFINATLFADYFAARYLVCIIVRRLLLKYNSLFLVTVLKLGNVKCFNDSIKVM